MHSDEERLKSREKERPRQEVKGRDSKVEAGGKSSQRDSRKRQGQDRRKLPRGMSRAESLRLMTSSRTCPFMISNAIFSNFQHYFLLVI